MGDVKLSSKPATTTTAGTFLPINVPDGGSPTGFVTKRISMANIQASINNSNNPNISDLEDDVQQLQTDVVSLQDELTRVTFKSVSTNQTFSQPQYAQIDSISVLNNSGSMATFSIGTTSSGTDIVDVRTINDTDWYLNQPGSNGVNSDGAARTVYITVSGTINVTIFYRINNF